jgi:hypothetical protein
MGERDLPPAARSYSKFLVLRAELRETGNGDSDNFLSEIKVSSKNNRPRGMDDKRSERGARPG